MTKYFICDIIYYIFEYCQPCTTRLDSTYCVDTLPCILGKKGEHFMWTYIIDGALILILVVSIIIGIAKGFFDSLLSLIGTGIALVASVFCAKYLTNFVNQLFGLEGWILGKLNESSESIKFFGGKFTLENAEVAKFVVWVVTVVALFLIIKLAIFILAKIFESVTKTSPTVSGINRILGMIFGAVKGAVTAACILAVCCMLGQVPFIGSSINDQIAQTKLTSWAYKYVDDFVENNLTEENVKDIVDRIVSEAETPTDTPA